MKISAESRHAALSASLPFRLFTRPADERVRVEHKAMITMGVLIRNAKCGAVMAGYGSVTQDCSITVAPRYAFLPYPRIGVRQISDQ
jgi:hypothetical protein